MLDADHDLLASAERVVAIKASEFRAVESVVRGSRSVLSYIKHFDVASTKLLEQRLEEVGLSVQELRSPCAQMLLNLKLSQARTISHLAHIKAKVLGKLVLARRGSSLARSKVTGDQQLKNYLRTTSMSHSSLFVGQVTPVARELSECKGHQQGPPNRRTSTSAITASQQGHSAQVRAQPAKPHSSRQPFSASASSQLSPGKHPGGQAQGDPAKKP